MPEILKIPLDSINSSFKLRTILENAEVLLHFIWNGRAERWTMNILAPDETPLVMGIALNIDTELISRFEIIGLPLGRLMLVDGSGKSIECGRDDLGGRCQLYYATSV